MTSLEQKDVILNYLADNFKPGDVVSIPRDRTPSGIKESVVDDHIRTFVELGLVRYSKDKNGRDLTGTSGSIICMMKAAAIEFREKGGFRVQKSEPVDTNIVTNYYTLNGNNSRVNTNSTDNSYNLSSGADLKVFDDLIQLLRDVQEVNSEVVAAAISMKETAGSKQFNSSYTNFISLAANHMTIIAPYLPALTQFLFT